MIGLILVFFAGKFYYDLAKEYGKSKWGYAFIGVASFYIGQVIGSFLIYVSMDFFGANLFQYNRLTVSLLVLPLGILTCFLVYKILSKRAFHERTISSDDVLDDTAL